MQYRVHFRAPEYSKHLQALIQTFLRKDVCDVQETLGTCLACLWICPSRDRIYRRTDLRRHHGELRGAPKSRRDGVGVPGSRQFVSRRVLDDFDGGHSNDGAASQPTAFLLRIAGCAGRVSIVVGIENWQVETDDYLDNGFRMFPRTSGLLSIRTSSR